MMFSKTSTRGTGCLNWARPGLWGLRVGNCPVLPGCVTEKRVPEIRRYVELDMREARTDVFQANGLFPFMAASDIIAVPVPEAVKVIDERFASRHFFVRNLGVKQPDEFGILMLFFCANGSSFNEELADGGQYPLLGDFGGLSFLLGKPFY